MRIQDKTNEELLSDLIDLRRRYSELEALWTHAKETEKGSKRARSDWSLPCGERTWGCGTIISRPGSCSQRTGCAHGWIFAR